MALDKIGPYQFQGVLGRGGMGSVYRGVHQETGEIHAVKVLAPTYAHDDHFRGRFESEIKALIKLNHPNIVQLLSYGQEDGMLFFSMELVEGNSLFQMQRKGHQFDWRQVLSVARDVSKGLRHAHDRGVIHRDLKPGNLLMVVNEEGAAERVKITDFGIAKSFGSSQNTGDNVLGTMDFMSPEQAKGEPVTIRSDLYSLGTVLFTLLSGKPPFTANSVEESLRNLTRVPAPRVSSRVPDVPRQVDELIRKLMSKKPEERIPTAQALLHQVEAIEAELKEQSEARTAQLPPSKASDDTFQLSAPVTRTNTEVEQDLNKTLPDSADRKRKSRSAVTETPTAAGTQVLDDGSAASRPAGSTIDYFNTVTDRVRKQHAVSDDSWTAEKKGNPWPVAIALFFVILAGGYGVYRAYLPPSAGELFAKIEAGADLPQQILPEINSFLEHYPDEPRAGVVQELQQIGEAVRLYNSLCNTLTVKRNYPGESRLSEIEKQFLDIVDIAEDRPEEASDKMKAFVLVHRNTDGLSERDQKCIDAAESYQIKIKNDARVSVLFDLKQIRSAMRNAEKTTDPQEAIPVYRSILKLYENTNWGAIEEAEEGRKLVKRARTKLAQLEER